MTLVFYDDSPVFGGHEVMTLLGLEGLLSRPDLHIRFFAFSSKLLESLTSLALLHPHRLHVHPLERSSSKLEALRHHLQPRAIRRLASRFSALAPNLIVAVQGNIEHSSLALLAARRAGIPSLSYIPVPHSHTAMGARGGPLRDLFTRPLFQLPDAFLTITPEMERLLRLRGSTRPVRIAPNGIDTGRFQPGDPASARAALQLPPTTVPVLGIIGRIEFKQKGQDLLARAAASTPQLATAHLVFAGEGPDSGKLTALLGKLGLTDRSTVLPWVDTARLYPALSALVIPSRFEGLPLVMLEALACGIPVFGTDRDGMRDVLPPEQRFPHGDCSALATLLARFVAAGCPPPPPDLVRHVRDHMNLDCFRQHFTQMLLA